MDVQECNETHAYPCRDRTKCIPFSWICNNNPDCEDGDDEQNCTIVPLSNDVSVPVIRISFVVYGWTYTTKEAKKQLLHQYLPTYLLVR